MKLNMTYGEYIDQRDTMGSNILVDYNLNDPQIIKLRDLLKQKIDITLKS